ncbi:hypothetical protein GCM10022393_15850 [Aquimarina addita]|uniref:CBM6 domain-containing protein n=1 Tax=Aquimarina addita TaxID=870485 RepID=A0ABP7XGE9_9FLAO
MLRKRINTLVTLVALVFAFTASAQDEWNYLIDEDLSQWEIWMGVPHVTTGLPGATSTDGISGTPLGLGNDPLNVFSVINEGGELQLKITGEVYGGLTTLAEYSNYHLSVQFKWGEDKYEPRLDKLRDSGILYHCQGEHGSFWNVWKSSLEFQVQEGDCGDYIGLAGAQGYIQSSGKKFSPGSPLDTGGLISASENFENPNGEWNTLEVITVGDKSMHFVNGNLINALENSVYGGAILTDGQIQIQSEGAELYYRDMKIKSVTDFPAEEKALLGWDGSTPITDAPIGSTITLQKSGGDLKYVTNNGTELLANSTLASESEEFIVEAHPSGGVALKSNSTGKYVQVQGNNTTAAVRATGENPGTWERFEWVAKGTGKVALKSVFTSQWVQASYNVDNAILYPSGADDGTWETFNFVITDEVTNPPTDKGKVLVFHKTIGFRHSSIDDGINMIRQQGIENGLWDTDDSLDPAVFTAANLEQYDVVIWCNTKGENLLNISQEAAFEEFIRNGGGYVGIHAATDTYRNGDWPFYNDLVGAIVQTSPYHTSNNYNATMTINDPSHPTVDFLGSTWNKSEEYYYWRNNGGQLYSGNINLLTVEATGTNDYDESRPIAWYKEYEGGRSFYTALGHNDSDYTDDSNFMRHVEEGIKWAGNFDETITLPTNDNLALNGAASQSSTGYQGIASRAIDGDTNGAYFDGSVTHTNTENNAWWQVELDAQENIGEIIIYNRVDCCEERLSDFTVIVTDSSNNETYRQAVTTIPDPSLTIDAGGALGKIVRIQSNLSDSPLSLAEVEVYAGVTSSPTRIEAEDFDDQFGIQTEASSEGTDNVGWINNNDWLKFDAIDLTGMNSLDARVACVYTGGDIEVRLGSATGTLLGTASVVNTGGNQLYGTVSTNLSDATGVNDIYFVFTGGNGFLFNVNWFEFSSATRSAEENLKIGEFPILAYPNPSSGIVTLENIPEKSVLKFSDMSGKTIKISEIINGTERVLDISTLDRGMYILWVNGVSRSILKE